MQFSWQHVIPKTLVKFSKDVVQNTSFVSNKIAKSSMKLPFNLQKRSTRFYSKAKKYAQRFIRRKELLALSLEKLRLISSYYSSKRSKTSYTQRPKIHSSSKSRLTSVSHFLNLSQVTGNVFQITIQSKSFPRSSINSDIAREISQSYFAIFWWTVTASFRSLGFKALVSLVLPEIPYTMLQRENYLPKVYFMCSLKISDKVSRCSKKS